MIRFLLVVLFFAPLSAVEWPWGREADLACISKRPVLSECVEESYDGPLEQLAELLIAFHQNVISPADGPRSHFMPSSSQYTLDAIQKYGFFLGVVYGCDRLMRENNEPWIYPKTAGKDGKPVKFDPVR